MVHCVYIHQNKKNGKIYVGYSGRYEERWKDTLRDAFNPISQHYGLAISGAIRKYGWDGFTHQVIEEFDDQKEALEA
jgi:predicted GIY-YIG superfamily endonuclease